MSVFFFTSRACKHLKATNDQIHRHGGAVLPKFDPATATHIVTETNEKNTLRALGLKSLSEIPLEIPTVYWSWVLSGKAIPGERDKQQMDYEFMHAAFPSRMDAGRPLTDKGKGKQKVAVNEDQTLHPGETSCVVSRIHYPIVCSFIFIYRLRQPTSGFSQPFVTRIIMRSRRRGARYLVRPATPGDAQREGYTGPHVPCHYVCSTFSNNE